MSSEFKTKNIVLVHGASQDGSIWSDVIRLLQAEGLKVRAVQNPLTSLKDDVTATNRVINNTDGNVILAGHSYGGTVITEAGINPKVSGLVYVAALAPDAEESFDEVAGRFPETPGSDYKYFREVDGIAELTEEFFAENFAQELPVEKSKVFAATQKSISASLFSGTTHDAAWRIKPTYYAVSKNDRVIHPDMQRFFAKRMNANTTELDAGHASQVSMPSAIAKIILEAARN